MNPATDAPYTRPEDREHRGRGRTDRRRLGMRHRRKAPDDDRDREAELRPEPIHHAARNQESDGIRELEGKDDVGVVDLGPAELVLERRLQDPDDLAIDVVDGRSKEQQAADDPRK
jgi:hypothetical protein